MSRDLTEYDALWNVVVKFNDAVLCEFEGVNLPANYTIKARHWTYARDVPKAINPFEPPYTSSVIHNMSIPVPRTRPCHFGRQFTDLQSSVQQIYVGVGNDTDYTDNIAEYTPVYRLCHPCEQPCDRLKCDADCSYLTDDDVLILPIHITNLTLHPGDYDTQNYSFASSLAESDQTLTYTAVRYNVLVKAVNSAGLETIAVSPGIKIDLTPPEVIKVQAVDPRYDPFYPASYQGYNDSLGAWWDVEDIESEIREYFVAIGTAPNLTDIQEFTSVGLDFEVIVTDLGHVLKNGHTYYMCVRAENHAGLVSSGCTDGITVLNEYPSVHNVSVSVLNAQLWTGGESSLWVTQQQDSFGIGVSGDVEDGTFIIGM